MLQQWHEFLMKQGAHISDSTSVHFGDLKQELAALSTQNCMMDLSSFGLLSISGPDAKSFLQGQITCNIDELTQKKSLLGAHCNLKGRMQSLFSIAVHPDNQNYSHFLLCIPTSMLTITQNNFKKFAIFSKVEIKVADDMVGIGLVGLEAPHLIANIKQNISVYHKEGAIPRYELFGPMEEMKQLWLQWKTVCMPISTQASELLDIRAGLPMVYPATIDEILPHHANLSILEGISYNKGCYLGQEIIARMQYRGKLKKHMYRVFVQDKSKPKIGSAVLGSTLTTNEAPGIVVRASESDQDGYELLIILDDLYQNFENVRLYSADGPKVLRLDLPYSW
ncbi:MAG: folate-binding protein YgfZ [Gammaproteobacteria bacterium]|jgi:folate-binding protein YgfZ|nr:folate-binding protein YgfZ [Gammaproteobacteria bacterium]